MDKNRSKEEIRFVKGTFGALYALIPICSYRHTVKDDHESPNSDPYAHSDKQGNDGVPNRCILKDAPVETEDAEFTKCNRRGVQKFADPEQKSRSVLNAVCFGWICDREDGLAEFVAMRP